jgi:hypothetical protein
LPEFDVRQGPDEPAAALLVDRRIVVPEAAVILGQLLLGITVVAVVLLLLPFLLVMAGVEAAMLLRFVASAAVLGVLVYWLVFPGAYGAGSPAAYTSHRIAACGSAISARRFLIDARPPACRLRAHRDRTDATHAPALEKSS